MKTHKHILIISDTHTCPERVYDCVDQDGPFDLVLHMGDMTGSQDVIEAAAGCPLEAVRGNCDYNGKWPMQTLTEVGDKLIFMTHGHQYGVNYDLRELEEEGRCYGADIVMYGHTHIPHYEELEDGMIILNPGSLGSPRQTPRVPTYMIMDIDEESGECQIRRRSLGEAVERERTSLFQELFKDFRKK